MVDQYVGKKHELSDEAHDGNLILQFPMMQHSDKPVSVIRLSTKLT